MGVGGLVEVFMLWATSRKLEIVLRGGGESMLEMIDRYVLVRFLVCFVSSVQVQVQVASIFGALNIEEDITIASFHQVMSSMSSFFFWCCQWNCLCPLW